MLVYGSYELYKKEISENFPSLDTPQVYFCSHALPNFPRFARDRPRYPPVTRVTASLIRPPPSARVLQNPRCKCEALIGVQFPAGSRPTRAAADPCAIVRGARAGALHLRHSRRHHGLRLDRALREHKAGKTPRHACRTSSPLRLVTARRWRRRCSGCRRDCFRR